MWPPPEIPADALPLGTGPATRKRERAPRRSGQRTQLTVPSELWRAAEELAEQHGTTPNDIVVRLAASGLELARRRLEIRALADERWSTYLAHREHRLEAVFPPEEAVLAAILEDDEE